MHMIFGDVTFHDRDFHIAADLADQLPEPETYFACHRRLAVLRNPDQMQVNAEDRMCAVSILRHTGESITRQKTC